VANHAHAIDQAAVLNRVHQGADIPERQVVVLSGGLFDC
jgi:hypothetical protein